MTQAGVILGMAAYMSAEQARGKPVDKRTDIWAFGCVLFEMLTGRRAFMGEDVSEALAAGLNDEPDWTALPVIGNALGFRVDSAGSDSWLHQGDKMSREIIYTSKAAKPPATYSQAIKAAGLVFVSGTARHDPAFERSEERARRC
jgi:serine/threonine protein kinase